MVHRPSDAFLPGAKPAKMIGRGAQLYLRTSTHAYVAYMRPRCACAPGLLVLDETLFDLASDPGEASNLAYDPSHSATRRALLQIVQQEWHLGDVIGADASRPERVALIEELASCFNYSLRCPTALGDL